MVDTNQSKANRIQRNGIYIIETDSKIEIGGVRSVSSASYLFDDHFPTCLLPH